MNAESVRAAPQMPDRQVEAGNGLNKRGQPNGIVALIGVKQPVGKKQSEVSGNDGQKRMFVNEPQSQAENADSNNHFPYHPQEPRGWRVP